jgi:hypothetical protein
METERKKLIKDSRRAVAIVSKSRHIRVRLYAHLSHMAVQLKVNMSLVTPKHCHGQGPVSFPRYFS